MCFYEADRLKIEKEKAMIRFKNIGSIFRTLEFLFLILFFSWSIFRTSPYFAAVFQLLGDFLRRLSALIVNPHFVFLLGNGIIVTLFVKFGQFACNENSPADEDYEIGEVAVDPPYDVASCVIPLEAVTVPEVKQIIIPAEVEVTLVEEKKDSPVVFKRELPEVKRYRRSRSNVIDRKKTETTQLRRSETELPRNSVKETAPVWRKFDVDNLSNEEFRQKVELVIEQHRRSLREESMFIVSSA